MDIPSSVRFCFVAPSSGWGKTLEEVTAQISVDFKFHLLDT